MRGLVAPRGGAGGAARGGLRRGRTLTAAHGGEGSAEEAAMSTVGTEGR